MIRNDFVSNSSSSSFILTINKDYPLKDFIKNVSKNCVNKKSKYPIDRLEERNKTILNYSFNEIQLMFLGSLYLKTEKGKIVENHFKNSWEESVFDKIIKNAKNGKYRAFDTLWTVVSPDEIRYECDILRNEFTTKKNDYSYHFIYDKLKWDDVKKAKKYRDKENKHSIKEMIKFLIKLNDMDYGIQKDFNWPTYIIDKRTLELTKILLEYGMKIKFDKILTLKNVENLLNEGKKIIVMEVGFEGNGMDSRRIYSENDSYVFNNVPVDILHSEEI